MRFFTREKSEEPSLRELVNELQARVEALEIANAERHIAVLNSCQKLANSLAAIQRKRELALPDDDTGDVVTVPSSAGRPPVTRRLRGF